MNLGLRTEGDSNLSPSSMRPVVVPDEPRSPDRGGFKLSPEDSNYHQRRIMGSLACMNLGLRAEGDSNSPDPLGPTSQIV